MNKKVYVGIIALGALATAGWMAKGLTAGERAYQPRAEKSESQKVWNYSLQQELYKMRANQHTGIVDEADVLSAREEVNQFVKRQNKATFPLSWQFAGPDNFGGRTRCVLVDRNDNNILYAGGVMGGLFKSTNKGASWYPINDQFQDMSVVSLCQTKNGTIYFGTGESFTGGGAQESGTPGFPGGGIYKSTDGKTFERIPITSAWTYVNRLVAHPDKNVVFAATRTGLRVSTENDDTKWSLAQGGNAQDFAIDKNGVGFVYTNTIYRSTTPEQSGSYSTVTGIPIPNVSRMVVAPSYSDPNYVYVVQVGRVGFESPRGDAWAASGLRGVYQSKDNGQTFERIVGSMSSFFAPFSVTTLLSASGPTDIDGKRYSQIAHSQGTFDLCVAVHPTNREHIYIGGRDFVEWTPEAGPRIVGNNNDHKANRFGIHADKHMIIFDTVSNPTIMYIATDGGIAKTTNSALNNYTSLYNGYSATQFYGIAAGPNGFVMGGTQDNGSIAMDGDGNTEQSGVEVLGGDGFHCAVSQINPDVIFAETLNGMMARSFNAGGTMSSIWSERVKEYLVSVNSRGEVRQASSAFNGPMHLWENLEDSSNGLFFPLNDGVWFIDQASTRPNPDWFRILDGEDAWGGRLAHQMHASADGAHFFVSATNGSTLVRVDGLDQVSWDTSVIKGNDIPAEITYTNIGGSLPSSMRTRHVTDIEVDQSNPNRVIVTFGNYGNTSYVYITENALDASPTWRSIQGALPRLPVYDAEISYENPNTIILGTEEGIFYTQNGSAATPTWTFNQDSMPRVPVYMMVQSESKVWKNGSRTGAVLYAGTHGRGIWKTNNLLTGIKEVSKTKDYLLKAYPNPVQSTLNIELPVRGNDNLTVEVLNYSGQVVRTQKVEVASVNTSIQLDVDGIPAGNYLVSIKGSLHSGATKFVKID